ncbi:MAG: DUF2971 domain-containing protein [Lachnotalea sp.]
MEYLYHYCGNIKCFSILQSKTIRLCDIRKSNDYNELQIFYPDIFNCVLKSYMNNPFPLTYSGKKDIDAMMELLEFSQSLWEDRFLNGDFSNFVMCFSEGSDSLSQWRGYADYGKGCCLGFSHDLLQQYCLNSKGVLRLEKVEYITDEQVVSMAEKYSNEALMELRTLRQWIVDNMTYKNEDPDTDGLLSFNFNCLLENLINDSLKYKSIGFNEENEWRLFLSNHAYKQPGWVCGNEQIDLGPNGFAETIAYLKNKIEFNITSDDIIPYLPIKFSEFRNNPIEELWLGPKNKISKSDIELFIKQSGYENMNVIYSNISYR